MRGTIELANWVLGMMPYVEVLTPLELRAEVRRRMVKAAELHEPARKKPALAAKLEAVPGRGRGRAKPAVSADRNRVGRRHGGD